MYYKAALCVVSTSTNFYGVDNSQQLRKIFHRLINDYSARPFPYKSQSVLNLPCFTECLLFGLTANLKWPTCFRCGFYSDDTIFNYNFRKSNRTFFLVDDNHVEMATRKTIRKSTTVMKMSNLAMFDWVCFMVNMSNAISSVSFFVQSSNIIFLMDCRDVLLFRLCILNNFFCRHFGCDTSGLGYFVLGEFTFYRS